MKLRFSALSVYNALGFKPTQQSTSLIHTPQTFPAQGKFVDGVWIKPPLTQDQLRRKWYDDTRRWFKET